MYRRIACHKFDIKLLLTNRASVSYNSVFLQWINTYCIKYTKIQWFCANLGSENSEANVLNHKNDHLFPICMTIMMLSSTSWSGKWECLSTRGKKKNLARIFEWLHHIYGTITPSHFITLYVHSSFIISCCQCHSTMNFLFPIVVCAPSFQCFKRNLKVIDV